MQEYHKKQEYNLMSTKYKKFRSFLLPKEIVDLLFLSAHVTPLLDNKESEIIIGLAVINDILSKSNQKRKNENYPFHFNPMASIYLQLKYGNDYKDYLQWLVIRNIVWSDKYHKGKATSYYLHAINAYVEFNTRLLKENEIKPEEIKEVLDTYCIRDNIEIILETHAVNGIEGVQKNGVYNKWYRIKVLITKTNRKFLTRDYEDDATFINNAPTYIKKMGSYYKKHLKIDYDAAMNHSINRYNMELEESKTDKEKVSAHKRYSSRVSSINSLYNGSLNKSLRFNRNDTNKRLDTNLTNMASDLRKFILGVENMSYLDLSNSQPVLFNIILKSYLDTVSDELKKEIRWYSEITLSGQWYECLQKLYNLSRDECKQIWMQIAYSENDHYLQVKKVFKAGFPEIYSLIEKIKQVNYEQFAIELQLIESKIFIDEICRELVNQNIIPYTMHDGLLVPIEHEQKTLDIMSSILKSHLGAVPKIKVENFKS
jgi:hypothetical protein